MSELKLYCSIGNHQRCSARGCSCNCHDARSNDTPPLSSSAREMRLLTFHCRQGQHDHCPAVGEICKCTCHKIVAIAQEVHRTVAQVLDQAANVIRTRLDEIEEELARYDDLRGERKELEAALKRLTPKERAARSSAEGSIPDAILSVVVGTNTDWSIPDVHDALKDLGMTPSAQAVSTACSTLTKAGSLERVSRGIYKAA